MGSDRGVDTCGSLSPASGRMSAVARTRALLVNHPAPNPHQKFLKIEGVPRLEKKGSQLSAKQDPPPPREVLTPKDRWGSGGWRNGGGPPPLPLDLGPWPLGGSS